MSSGAEPETSAQITCHARVLGRKHVETPKPAQQDDRGAPGANPFDLAEERRGIRARALLQYRLAQRAHGERITHAPQRRELGLAEPGRA